MPKTSRRAQRRDTNEKQLVELARSLGAHWNYLEAGQGADGILTNRRGVIAYVEIKDPNKSPSDQELTETEKNLKFEVDARGGHYEVVMTNEQMVSVCNLVSCRRPAMIIQSDWSGK